MTAMFQKTIQQIAERLLDAGAELLADTSISEEVRGQHAVNLLRILTVARPMPPPEKKVEWTQRPGGFVDLTDRVAPPAPVKAKKPKKKGKWGKQRVFTDAMISEALVKSGGNVAAAAKLLGCSIHTIYVYIRKSGAKSVDPRRANLANGIGVIWNAANRAKLHEMATRVPRPPLSEIAAALGTTELAIQTAMSRHGITKNNGRTPNTLTSRPCLNCHSPFMSTHKGNRRCPKCIAEDREVAA
jgi:transposase